MKLILLLIVGIFVLYFLYEKREQILGSWKNITEKYITIERDDLKELMNLSRGATTAPCQYERLCVAKVKAFLRDMSYKTYLEFGPDKYLSSFQTRVGELLAFMEINTIRNLPNREFEILKIRDTIYKETGLSIIKVKDGEYVNKFKLGNAYVSLFFPDPVVNRILGFHKPQRKDSSLVDLQYIKENFLPSKSSLTIGDLCR